MKSLDGQNVFPQNHKTRFYIVIRRLENYKVLQGAIAKLPYIIQESKEIKNSVELSNLETIVTRE
jgi:hypothetical protein